MLHFAQAEIAIFGLLVKTAGLSWDAANAVFSGARTDQSISSIRRLLGTRPTPEAFPTDAACKDLLPCFDQVAHIAKIRNSLVHYGVDLNERPFTTSNSMRALRDRKVMYEVSPETLHAMIVDLRKVVALITYHTQAHDDPKVSESFHAEYQNMQRPWRYTPLPPASGDPPLQERSPKLRRLPRS